MELFIQTERSKGSSEMNEILAKFEELSMEDLTYLFEYLVELINERKRQAERKKRLQRKQKCNEKNLKQ